MNAKRTRRRLTLLDVVVLVAAIAITIAMYGWFFPDVSWDGAPADLRRMLASHGPLLGSLWIIAELGILAQPAFGLMGVALLALRVAGPRPRRWRRVWSQPGVLACLIIAVIQGLLMWIEVLRLAVTGEMDSVVAIIVEIALIYDSIAVIAGWMTLMLVGRWRPERDWIDRAGLAIGLMVVLTGLAMGLLMALERLR